MKYISDGYAVWTFQGYHECIDDNRFTEFSSQKKREFIKSRLPNLKVVLDALNNSNLFELESFYFNNGYRQLTQDGNIINSILPIIDQEEISSWSFAFKGSTLIYFNGKQEKISGIIGVLFEAIFDLISIETYSDIWQPMDIHGEDLNIERAIVNSDRLEQCLLEIKQEGIFKKIEPEEGVDERDECAQHGFRMYIEEWAFKEFYPDIEIDKFDKFIWERRNLKRNHPA